MKKGQKVMSYIEPVHDFAAKLRQASLFPRVKKYIEWQQAVRRAKSEKGAIPEMPESLVPISINLDLTTACNFRCGHCIDLDILNSGVNYEHPKLLVSLGNLIERGLRSVILIGGGEPTLYPKFREIVRFLKERNMQVAVVSNGARNEIIYEVAELFSGKDWIRLSLDSGSTETFLKIHRPRKPVTLEEICAWIPRIREKNPRLPVGFSFVIVWEGGEHEGELQVVPNIEEIVAATKLARKNRFNYISLKPFLVRGPQSGEIMDAGAVRDFDRTIARIRGAVNEAKSYETGEFKVVESTNLKVLENGSWRDFTCQPQMCHMQAMRQVLSPLGLFNCAAYRGIEKARIASRDAYSSTENMKDTSRATAAILERFDASRECAEITCLYNSANWLIERAIRGEISLAQFGELEDRGDYFL